MFFYCINFLSRFFYVSLFFFFFLQFKVKADAKLFNQLLMPAFVYLIPALFFFGIGVVPGVISSVIFAMPPTFRFTNLGIREVPADLVEAANAYGSTTKQKLFKVQLPLATKTIMAGINQSIMLSLSMVVIASLVGAPGLGAEVYRAVSRLEVGTGFEAGISIVILAIILDRITEYFGNRSNQRA
ncbi:ABC transporter permease [Priestia aryabhattai]|uniref:ABC transporter permease n=1 Tax=Priestia aryabhattai TaxID=412384 RepID=UPI003982DDC3